MLIAERTLRLQLRGELHRVPVRVFSPVQGQGAWGCRWDIHWPDRVRSGEAFGHDAMQALVLALQAIGSELYASDEHASGQLFWCDGRAGYGFPVPRIIRDRLVGDDAEFF